MSSTNPNPYCSTCGGRTDGYFEVGASYCRCLDVAVCPWCGGRSDGKGEGDERLCYCATLAGQLQLSPPASTPPPDPTTPYTLTLNDKKLLRSFRITPED